MMRVWRQSVLDICDQARRFQRTISQSVKLLPVRWFNRGPLLILAALGCVLILLNGVLAYASVRTLVSEQRASVQAHTVQTALEELSATLNAAQAAERAYLVTGNESDLTPYTSALVDLPEILDRLAGLTADDPAQRTRLLALKPLVMAQLDEMQAVISLRRTSGPIEAQRVADSLASKESADTADEVLGDMDTAQQRLLADQDEVVRMSSSATYIAVAFSTLSDIALLAGIIYLALRALDRREQIARERAELLAQEHAARQQAEAAVGLRDQFLSIASHELRSPLTALLGNAQLLRRRVAREGGISARNLQTLEVIPRQANRLRALIEAMLDVSRLDQGQLTLATAPLDLAAVARGVVDEAQVTAERHVLTCVGAGKPIYVMGDAVRLEQVLLNLVENAIKYSPRGGQVHVRVARRNDQAEVAVTDEGIGIPEEARAHLFERFYRAPNATAARINGTGIGLYVIREIVTLHGGSIAVTSAEGRGSTFTVSLPVLAESPATDPAASCRAG
jgi:signal transduction histidine kinase